MGMEYELFKPHKGERFELGKGMWSSVFPDGKGKDFQIVDKYGSSCELYWALLAGVAFGFDFDTTLKFFFNLAERIYDWCGDDIIQFHDMESFNDLYWNIKYKSYDDHEKEFPYTGSRYTKKAEDIKGR